MFSIRTKITTLTIVAITISMIAISILGAITIKDVGEESANEILYLLCQTGEKNLNTYFASIEQSVKVVSSYADELMYINKRNRKAIQKKNEAGEN